MHQYLILFHDLIKFYYFNVSYLSSHSFWGTLKGFLSSGHCYELCFGCVYMFLLGQICWITLWGFIQEWNMAILNLTHQRYKYLSWVCIFKSGIINFLEGCPFLSVCLLLAFSSSLVLSKPCNFSYASVDCPELCSSYLPAWILRLPEENLVNIVHLNKENPYHLSYFTKHIPGDFFHFAFYLYNFFYLDDHNTFQLVSPSLLIKALSVNKKEYSCKTVSSLWHITKKAKIIIIWPWKSKLVNPK